MTALFLVAALALAPAPGPRLEGAALPPLPDPLGVAAPVAGVSGGALLAGGGANFPNGFPWAGGRKVWHDRVWALEPGAAAWRAAGTLPGGPLAYAVSLTTERGILVAGGSDADRHHAEAFLLRWKDGRLETEALPPLPRAVANACGARVGPIICIAGGEAAPGATSALAEGWTLDLAAAAPTWTPMPAWPGPGRTLAQAAALGSEFLLLGGVALHADATGKPARVYLKDAYALDLTRRTWRRLADLPRPLAAGPSPAIPCGGRRVLLAGGDDGSRYGFQPVEKHPGFAAPALVYDASADAWAEAGPVPAPRATVPVVEWNGRFVVPSGEVRPGVRSPEVWAYRVKEAHGPKGREP